MSLWQSEGKIYQYNYYIDPNIPIGIYSKCVLIWESGNVRILKISIYIITLKIQYQAKDPLICLGASGHRKPDATLGFWFACCTVMQCSYTGNQEKYQENHLKDTVRGYAVTASCSWLDF